jgi:hypothetical protein
LDFLGFLRPIPAFSMGYEQPKGKIFPRPPRSAAPFSAPIDRKANGRRGRRNGFDGSGQLGGLLQGGAGTYVEQARKLGKRMLYFLSAERDLSGRVGRIWWSLGGGYSK